MDANCTGHKIHPMSIPYLFLKKRIVFWNSGKETNASGSHLINIKYQQNMICLRLFLQFVCLFVIMVLPINAINNAKLTWTRTSRKPHRPRGWQTSAKPPRELVQDESSTNLTFQDVQFHPNNVVFGGDPMILNKFHEGFLPSQEILRVHSCYIPGTPSPFELPTVFLRQIFMTCPWMWYWTVFGWTNKKKAPQNWSLERLEILASKIA